MTSLPAKSAYGDSAVLASGTLVSGLAAYAFIAIGTRSVGANAFAPVSVLWTLWAAAAAVLTFPIQHWVIRTVELDKGERTVRAALPSLAIASAALGVALGVGTWMLRGSLFGVDNLLYPIIAGLIPLGSAATGLNRGVLSARHQFRETAAAIAGENIIRSLAALIAVSSESLGLALASGFLVVCAWPSSFRLEDTGAARRQNSAIVFVGNVAAGSLIGQLILTLGPVVLALIGGTEREVTGLFSALALFRAPYMLATGIAPRVTAGLTRLALSSIERLRGLVLTVLVVTAVLGVLGGVIGDEVGVPLLGVLFGADVLVSSQAMALVAAASVAAISSLFLTLVMVASGRARGVLVCWMAAGLVGASYVVLAPTTPTLTVAGAFLISEIVAVVALSLILLGARRWGVGR